MRTRYVVLGLMLIGFAVVTWTGFNYAGLHLRAPLLANPSVKPDILRLTFGGDIMAHDVNFNRPPYDRIYSDITDILLHDDLSFANLEFPVDKAKPQSSYPRFNVHLDYVRAAVDAGFDVFSASNNHSTDQGAESVSTTAETLSAMDTGIWAGLRRHPEDPFHPVTINYGNWRIGFLSITMFVNLEEGKELVHSLNIYNRERTQAFLTFIEEIAPGYDLFILSVHGGTEYRNTPNKRKQVFFHQAIESGVDIVWGHHPHVLQPWEYVKYEGATKVIMYSTGNLISGQTWYFDPENPDKRTASTGESALFELSVAKDGKTVDIQDVNLQFLFNYKDKTMVIKKAETLINDPGLSSSWKSYYTQRYRGLQHFKEAWENEL